MPIPCQRTLFDIPEDVAYLNCSYLGPSPKSVVQAGYLGVERKKRPWKITPADFFTEAERLRVLAAKLVSSEAEDIAIIPAVSYGVAIAAGAIPVAPGQEIVLLAEQFPSNYYPWQALAKSGQARVVQVQRQNSQNWTEALTQAIGAQTRIVAIPNVHWTDGSLIDLQVVAQKCRAVGAELVLDLTQSLGALPFSVKEIDPAFVLSAGYKWLLGPYSVALMYVAPRFQDAEPLEHNWLNREASENFAALVNYREGFQPGARRFDVGERSNFALLPMTVRALEQILEWGVQEIQTTLSSITSEIQARAEQLGLQTPEKTSRAGHMLGVRFPKGLPERIGERLSAEQVFVSVRGSAIRIAPHLYNNQQDIDKLFSVLERSL